MERTEVGGTGAISRLVADVSEEAFFGEYFEKAPYHGAAREPMSIELAEIFAIMPSAHAAAKVRYLNQSTTPLGIDPAVVEKDYFEGLTAQDFDAFFARREFSYAIQALEEYVPCVRNVADQLETTLGSRVTSTAFVSPGGRSATNIHYDKSEVFVFHLKGSKIWKVFRPVTYLPGMRNPDVPLPEDLAKLELYGTYVLKPGDFLYLPRGWIHQVVNATDSPSLHVSFVALVDCVASVFGNLMADVYARLGDDARWRHGLSIGSLTNPATRNAIAEMTEEFSRLLTERAQGNLSVYTDHCLNGPIQRESVAAGKASITVMAEADGDVELESTRAHYILRDSDGGEFVKLSIDGDQYFPVCRKVYERLCDGKSTSVLALENANLCTTQTLADSIDVLVRVLGIYQLTTPAVLASEDIVA